MKKVGKALLTIIATLLALALPACQQDSIMAPQPPVMENIAGISADLEGGTFLRCAELTLRYHQKHGYYHGGNVNLGRGSNLRISNAALTPPPGTPSGTDVTVTMMAEKSASGDEIIFTFGPSGCQFDPPARIKLSWEELNVALPVLYYIDDNGTYMPMAPGHIDVQDKYLTIDVHQFSRYALGAE